MLHAMKAFSYGGMEHKMVVSGQPEDAAWPSKWIWTLFSREALSALTGSTTSIYDVFGPWRGNCGSDDDGNNSSNNSGWLILRNYWKSVIRRDISNPVVEPGSRAWIMLTKRT